MQSHFLQFFKNRNGSFRTKNFLKNLCNLASKFLQVFPNFFLHFFGSKIILEFFSLQSFQLMVFSRVFLLANL